MKTRNVPTQTITPGQSQSREDLLAIEDPLEIRIAYGAGAARKRLSVAVTMRTPGDDAELALGFLFTEGIIASPDQVLSIRQLDENTLIAELQPDLPVDAERLTRHLFTSSSPAAFAARPRSTQCKPSPATTLPPARRWYHPGCCTPCRTPCDAPRRPLN